MAASRERKKSTGPKTFQLEKALDGIGSLLRLAKDLRLKSVMLSMFLLGSGGWVSRSVNQNSIAAAVAQWAAAIAIAVGLAIPVALAIRAFLKDIKR